MAVPKGHTHQEQVVLVAAETVQTAAATAAQEQQIPAVVAVEPHKTLAEHQSVSVAPGVLV